MKKDWKKLRRQLRKRGWTVERQRSGHYHAHPPDGGDYVVLPSTASDWRALKNIKALLRRRMKR